jgi:sugar phosphate isomerase/epimerase
MHYHVHGYEFAPGRTGTLFDDLLAAFAPRCVEIELDVFWAAHGGADPVALLRRLGRRVTMLHLKDISADAGPGRPFAPDADNPPLGTGRIDMQGVLRAARENGVRWYILEDETSMAMARLPAALRYLRPPG